MIVKGNHFILLCTACSPGKYGGGCLGVCSCDHGTCDRQDGHCTCYSGWTGKYCNQRMFYTTLLYLVLVHVGILWIRLSQPLFVPVPTPYIVAIFIFNYFKWKMIVRFVAIREIVGHHCLDFPFMGLLPSQSIKYYHSM